jgi:hypothetical protein
VYLPSSPLSSLQRACVATSARRVGSSACAASSPSASPPVGLQSTPRVPSICDGLRVFPAVIDQACQVCGQVRSQFGQPLANLFDRRPAGIRFRSLYVNIDSGGKEHDVPVHHLLEQILNEYIEVAGLQSGQPLFQSVNSTGMEVTGRALNRYNAWAAIRKRAKAAGFSPPLDVTPGEQPASPFTWKTTAGWSTPSRWLAMSLPNDQALRPDKGRNYAERGGANPAVTFTWHLGRFYYVPKPEETCALNAAFSASNATDPIVMAGNSPGVS